MRPPPYLHVLNTPPSLAPGLRPISPDRWLKPDTERHWLPEKRKLMRAKRDAVFADQSNGAAIAELAPLIHSETQPASDDWPTQLEAVAAQVSDDICLLERGETGLWYLSAASLTAPTFWSLGDKIGEPLSGLHAPVPGANPGMVSRIQRIFDGLRPGQVLERFNWTIQASDARFTPSSTPLKQQVHTIPAARLQDVIHLRVERQTITKLPDSGAIVFTIRICLDPLRACLMSPETRAAFWKSWTETPDDLRAYKGWAAYENAVAVILAQLS